MPSGRTERLNIGGEVIANFHGLMIYAKFVEAKRGRNRIWIQIRQGTEKRYRVAATVCYMRTAGIQFEEAE